MPYFYRTTSGVFYSALYFRQDCRLHTLEQFEAQYVLKPDDKQTSDTAGIQTQYHRVLWHNQTDWAWVGLCRSDYGKLHNSRTGIFI